jgi:hypothetical protein
VLDNPPDELKSSDVVGANQRQADGGGHVAYRNLFSDRNRGVCPSKVSDL